MRWRAPFIVVLIAFVAVSCDQQPVEPQADQVAGVAMFNADQGVIHFVSVGGADVRKASGEKPADANLSLVAIMRADGTVRGEWQDSFGGSPIYTLHMDVNCLYVVGNEAWVSGVIKHSPGFPQFLGNAAIIRVVDNGRSRRDAPDQASKIEVEGTGDPTGSFDCLDATRIDLNDMNEGQVTVR